MMRKPMLGLSLVLLAISAVTPGCRKPPSNLAQGYVEGEFVHIAAPFGGRLEKLSVERGDEVAVGALLFELDDVAERAARDEARHRVSQAQAALEDATKGRRDTEIQAVEAELAAARAALVFSSGEFLRQQQARRSGAVAERELDAARASRDHDQQAVYQLEATLATARLGAREDLIAAARHTLEAQQAALTGAEWRLAQKSQRAPVAGRVADVVCRQGDYVNPGTPVVVLLPPANVRIRAFVPQRLLAGVRIGAAARVRLDGAAAPLTATVVYLAPRAEYTPPVIYSQQMREKFVYRVELAVPPEVAAGLHPGQPVDVEFTVATP